nr:type II toxin-antitoxin system HicA family toxin [Leucobacter exalbidus]
MKYRELAKLLRQAGFVPRQGKGDHEVWINGSHQTVITQTREISPGLVRQALKAIEEAS